VFRDGFVPAVGEFVPCVYQEFSHACSWNQLLPASEDDNGTTSRRHWEAVGFMEIIMTVCMNDSIDKGA